MGRFRVVICCMKAFGPPWGGIGAARSCQPLHYREDGPPTTNSSAKAGFTAFLSGLRNRLAKQGVHVVTVLPGFGATQMTEDMDLPARLTVQPNEVADAIARAVERKKDVVYVRPIWRFIVTIIRNTPEQVFKKMET